MEDHLSEVSIVTPVYNDWTAFRRMIEETDRHLAARGVKAHVYAIDDGSTESLEGAAPALQGGVVSVEQFRLSCNLGHQRAIAVGLTLAHEAHPERPVIVIDSDGEDRPEDVAALLDAAAQNPASIIVAKRAKRSEGLAFRAGYRFFRWLFRVLTGAKLDFGNFCFLPASVVGAVIRRPDTWNHLAASLLRSKLTIHKTSVARGRRYSGASKMNLPGLIVHGLSAIAVYVDIALARLLVLLSALAGLLIAIGVVVLVIRFGTDMAVPGWTTTVMGFIGLLLFQTAAFAAIAVLTLLNGRSATQVIPAFHAKDYLLERRAPFGG